MSIKVFTLKSYGDVKDQDPTGIVVGIVLLMSHCLSICDPKGHKIQIVDRLDCPEVLR